MTFLTESAQDLTNAGEIFPAYTLEQVQRVAMQSSSEQQTTATANTQFKNALLWEWAPKKGQGRSGGGQGSQRRPGKCREGQERLGEDRARQGRLGNGQERLGEAREGQSRPGAKGHKCFSGRQQPAQPATRQLAFQLASNRGQQIQTSTKHSQKP